MPAVALEQEFLEGTEEVVRQKGHGQGPPPNFREPFYDPGGNGSNGERNQPFGNAFVAMLLFIGADVMLFAGLIGAFIVFRFGAEDWPPIGQPLLPVGVTGLNSAILLLSGVTMARSWQALAKWNRKIVQRWLIITAIAGMTFLLVQGYEWMRLIGFGLTISSSVYGAIFYVLIGAHALHVLGAVIWLLIVNFRLSLNSGAYHARRTEGIKLAGMYWFLVVALWPVLYTLVYLS